MEQHRRELLFRLSFMHSCEKSLNIILFYYISIKLIQLQPVLYTCFTATRLINMAADIQIKFQILCYLCAVLS